MNTAALQTIITHIREHVQQYYSEFGQAEVRVELAGTSEHSASTMYCLELATEQRRRAVLVKTPPSQGQPLRMIGQTRAEIKFQLEYEALVAIHRHFESLRDSRLSAIRPLDFISEPLAIIMEKVEAPSFRHLLKKASRFHSASRRRSLVAAFRNAGAWLRAFHALPERDRAQVCEARREDYLESVKGLAASLGDQLGDKPYFQQVATKISNEAMAALPESLPLGIKHGDFAVRNLLVDRHGRVTGIDTQAKLRAPIYDDIAYFLVALRTTWPQVFSQGLVFSSSNLRYWENAFLHGYFGESEIPVTPIRLFKIKMMMDRWSTRAFYVERLPANWRSGPRFLRQRLTHRFFRRNLEALLRPG